MRCAIAPSLKISEDLLKASDDASSANVSSGGAGVRPAAPGVRFVIIDPGHDFGLREAENAAKSADGEVELSSDFQSGVTPVETRQSLFHQRKCSRSLALDIARNFVIHSHSPPWRKRPKHGPLAARVHQKSARRPNFFSVHSSPFPRAAASPGTCFRGGFARGARLPCGKGFPGRLAGGVCHGPDRRT